MAGGKEGRREGGTEGKEGGTEGKEKKRRQETTIM
jgi:hypothetical protein